MDYSSGVLDAKNSSVLFVCACVRTQACACAREFACV